MEFLYNIFVYQSSSGILLWDRNFNTTNRQQVDLFSSFFAAIKIFVRELITKGDDELKNIEIGEQLIILFSVKELKVDLVFIADVNDEKTIMKVAPKLLEILRVYKKLFEDLSSGDVRKFDVLSQPILDALSRQKGLIDQNKSLLDEDGTFIRRLFAKRDKLDSSIEISLLAEQDRLQNLLTKSQNLFVKHEILDGLIEIQTKLGDGEKFLASSREERKTIQDIMDLHIRLNYWLKQTKEHLKKAIDSIAFTQKSLQDADYKDVFRNLIDFASNIKKVADEQVSTRFYDLARYLMDKGTLPPELLRNAIRELLNLKDDAFDIVRETGIPSIMAQAH